MGVDSLIAVADAGYYSEAQLAECEQANVTAYVAIPDKHQAIAAEGRLSGAHFHYVAGADVYVCPGGEVLHPQGQPVAKRGVRRTRYTRPARQCQGCPLKAVCLPEKTPQRQIWRSEHARAVQAHRQRMAEEGAKRMSQRAGLAEHPFGTLKR